MSAAIRRGVPDIAPSNATVSGMLRTTGRRSPPLGFDAWGYILHVHTQYLPAQE